jgi:hypothetical protein
MINDMLRKVIQCFSPPQETLCFLCEVEMPLGGTVDIPFTKICICGFAACL